MVRLVWDLETNGLLDTMTKIHCMSLRDADTKEEKLYVGHSEVSEGLDRLMKADKAIGHNIVDFDIPAVQKIFPEFTLKDNQVVDTILLSRLIWSDLRERDFGFRKKLKGADFPGYMIGRHSLEAWGHRLGLNKGDYSKEMKALGLDPWESYNDAMGEYCSLDTEVTAKLNDLIDKKEYSQQAIDLEHDFRRIIKSQEEYGFMVDQELGWDLYSRLNARKVELEGELRVIFPAWLARGAKTTPKRSMRRFVPCEHGKHTHPKSGAQGYYEFITEGVSYYKIIQTTFNPGSRDHISNRLIHLYGWKPSEFGADGKPTVNEVVLKTLKYKEVPHLQEYLMIAKRLGQLADGKQAILKLVGKDGRMHGRVITNGAVTGRCTHNSPNVAQTPACGAPYGKEFRALYRAKPGYKIVGADASGLELRMLAHYMAKYDNGQYAEVILNGDIHTVNQLAAGLPTRDNAKTFIYGFLYGAGDEKIGAIIGKGMKAGRQLKNEFLNKTPALKSLRNAVQRAVKTKGFLVGLDGRHLPIRSEHAALNTLLQSAGALIMKQWLVIVQRTLKSTGLVEGQDYGFTANVHDEAQLEVKEEHAKTVARILEESFPKAGEVFNMRCRIDGEAKIGSNWSETH